MSDKTGGPAFPVNFMDWHEGKLLNGLTMLDHFAGLAMQGLMAQSMGTGYHSPVDEGARFAYDMAAAMLRAREKHLEG